MNKIKLSLLQKVAAAILLLTVASCCLFSSMFAKYTTGSDGGTPDSARVAKWDVDAFNADKAPLTQSFTIVLDDFAPLMDQAHVWTRMYVIENHSEVTASVAVKPQQLTFYKYDGTEYEGDLIHGEDPLTVADMQEVVQVSYQVVETNAPEAADWTNATVHTTESAVTLPAKTDDTASAVTIKVTVTWRKSASNDEDIVDGLIGVNIASAKADIVFTASQVD